MVNNGPDNSTYTQNWTRVNYKDTPINISASLKHDKGLTFTSPGLDLYLFSVMTMAPINGSFSMKIVGLDRGLGLTDQSTNNAGLESLGLNVVVPVPASALIHLEFKQYISASASNGWAGVSISGYFSPLVAFSVAQSHDSLETGVVKYDMQLVNTGTFDMDTSTFVAPQDGIYYFSVGAAVSPFQPAAVRIYKNDTISTEVLHNSTIRNGIEQLSGASLIQLQTGDRVTVQVSQGSIYSSPGTLETSFHGFLYSRNVTSGQVAWRMSKVRTTHVAMNDRVSFDLEHVSVQSNVNMTDTTVTIPVSGVYYLHVSITTPPGNKSDILLHTVNKNIRLQHRSGNLNGYYTMSGGYVVRLDVGDQVWVEVMNTDGTTVYGDQHHCTAFMGFLITEE